MLSWMAGICKKCAHPVVVAQGQAGLDDYCWYCSNPACENHNAKEGTFDMEHPSWVNLKGERITPIRMGK